MTVTDTPAAAGAVETAPEKVSSHLHPEGSFEVADHIVPTGREEIWRFTPLKRLRKLHADAEFGAPTTSTTWNAPDGVRVEEVDGEEARGLRGISGLVPNTLFGARVLAEVPTTLLVDVPAEAEVAEPDHRGAQRHGARRRPRLGTSPCASATTPVPWWCSTTPDTRRWPRSSRCRWATAPRSRSSPFRTGPTTRST